MGELPSREAERFCLLVFRSEGIRMDLLAVFVILVIVTGILVLYLTRAPANHQEIESLQVINNLGDRNTPKRGGFLAWGSPVSLPIVVTEANSPVVENVLVFEEYPLVPLRVYSTWIPPGQCIDVIVWKDDKGNVLDLKIAP